MFVNCKVFFSESGYEEVYFEDMGRVKKRIDEGGVIVGFKEIIDGEPSRLVLMNSAKVWFIIEI